MRKTLGLIIGPTLNYILKKNVLFIFRDFSITIKQQNIYKANKFTRGSCIIELFLISTTRREGLVSQKDNPYHTGIFCYIALFGVKIHWIYIINNRCPLLCMPTRLFFFSFCGFREKSPLANMSPTHSLHREVLVRFFHSFLAFSHKFRYQKVTTKIKPKLYLRC